MVALAQLPLRMTVQEFLNWDSGDDVRYELVDGIPRAMAPAKPAHGLLQMELGGRIRNHLRQQRKNCDVVVESGVIPQLLSGHNVRIPDLAVTCAPISANQSLLPEPILVIEILSPSNQADTWNNVWAYTTIPTVQEILILRSDRIAADLLRKLPNQAWPDEPVSFTDGTLILESIGFDVPLPDLYARIQFAS